YQCLLQRCPVLDRVTLSARHGRVVITGAGAVEGSSAMLSPVALLRSSICNASCCATSAPTTSNRRPLRGCMESTSTVVSLPSANHLRQTTGRGAINEAISRVSSRTSLLVTDRGSRAPVHPTVVEQ